MHAKHVTVSKVIGSNPNHLYEIDIISYRRSPGKMLHTYAANQERVEKILNIIGDENIYYNLDNGEIRIYAVYSR